MTKRLKIIRLQSRICIGGPAIHMEMLARFLPVDKYETILVGGMVEEHERDKSGDFREKNIQIIVLDRMKREVGIWSDLKSLLQFYRILRQERPDIVCTHTAKAGAIGRVAAFLARVPVIVHTFHGHVFNNYFGKIKTRIFILIERALAMISDQVITISPEQYRDITATYRIASPGKVSMIRLGLDLEPLRNLPHSDVLRRSLDLPEGSILMGFIGRLVPIKNLGMALHVLERLLLENQAYHLCIAGDGPEKAQWHQYSEEKGLTEHVHFLGWVERIAYILSGIDILILTSRNEGTPIAVIEAMASRVPVIATAVGGVPDLIQNERTGFTVPSDDVEAMVRYITRVTQAPESLGDLKKAAEEEIYAKYEYHHLVREIDQLYSRLYFNKTRHLQQNALPH
ncbi:MAG TPA: glycosyltransferase [bacterium]|nr:glycosyltransferase [bacterium]